MTRIGILSDTHGYWDDRYLKYFENCDEIVELTIPANVERLGTSSFEDCDKLTSVTLSEGLTGIGEAVFCRCDKITEITVPQSVRYVEIWAFQSMPSLNTITFLSPSASPSFKVFSLP